MINGIFKELFGSSEPDHNDGDFQMEQPGINFMVFEDLVIPEYHVLYIKKNEDGKAVVYLQIPNSEPIVTASEFDDVKDHYL